MAHSRHDDCGGWHEIPAGFEDLFGEDAVSYEPAPPDFFESCSSITSVKPPISMPIPMPQPQQRPMTYAPPSWEGNEDYDKKVESALQGLLEDMEEIHHADAATDAEAAGLPPPEPSRYRLGKRKIGRSRDHMFGELREWDSFSTKMLIVARAQRLDFRPLSSDLDMWDDVSENMACQGYNIDGPACELKWKELWRKFRAIFKEIGTGPFNPEQQWIFFPLLRSFYLRSQAWFNPSLQIPMDSRPVTPPPAYFAQEEVIFSEPERASPPDDVQKNPTIKTNKIEIVTIGDGKNEDGFKNQFQMGSSLKAVHICAEAARVAVEQAKIDKDRKLHRKRINKTINELKKAKRTVPIAERVDLRDRLTKDIQDYLKNGNQTPPAAEGPVKIKHESPSDSEIFIGDDDQSFRFLLGLDKSTPTGEKLARVKNLVTHDHPYALSSGVW